MKTTNDMIDKVTEVCLDIAVKINDLYEDVLREFLEDYLKLPVSRLELTGEAMKRAKKARSQEQWQRAYERFCQRVYGQNHA